MSEFEHLNRRPYPQPCSECGRESVQPSIIAYDAAVKHDGRLYQFHIPELHVDKCANCGEFFINAASDDEISQALRKHLGLLSPEEIRGQIETLGLTQKEFGERIGVAAETISRWLSGGYIQSRAMDNLMRFFFELERTKSSSPIVVGVQPLSSGEPASISTRLTV
jgi:putative zinc finger/helix-turn-helix YgiT family protein